jgi:hypothetical protein
MLNCMHRRLPNITAVAVLGGRWTQLCQIYEGSWTHLIQRQMAANPPLQLFVPIFDVAESISNKPEQLRAVLATRR